ncbi:uncharacterized protein LOC143857066 [Tasmannia lanceolata]|uniref:uncharacterized protein LOC143857066 n=1 Tax=Tasmannia lanceolata TaxID=3420 RepID=UPI00406393E6
MTSFNSLARILEDNKLTDPNYIDWKRNLMPVLTAAKLYWFLRLLNLKKPTNDASQAKRDRRQKWTDDNEIAKCYILGSISNVLQQQHVGMATTMEIMINLKELFGE